MKLAKLRADSELSQELVARKLEVSRQTIANWEDGKSIPNAEKAIEIAKLFNVTVEELMEK